MIMQKIMQKTGKAICLLLLALAVVCGGVLGLGITAHAQASSCSVCGTAYDNGFCATENCTGAYEPAGQTNIEGTDFYTIGNAGQLYWFAALVNGGEAHANAVLTADITVNKDVLRSLSVDKNGNVVLNDGVVLREWIPIGREGQHFLGVFDGNGHSVSGLYFNDNTKSDVGLIGTTGSVSPGCEIRNVTVKDSFFMGKSNVGAIAGRLSYSSVKNCSQTGLVCGVTGSIGGLIGYGDNVNIEDCVNAGEVRSVSPRGPRGELVGGLIGGLNAGEMKNCRNTGSVSGGTSVGGAAGMIRTALVIGCENEGSVTGNTGGNSTGGIVGGIHFGGAVENCINKGAVIGVTSVGGIVGASDSGTLTACENMGAVSGDTSVGGVIGYNSKNTGDYSVKDCSNGGSVKGNASVGGVIGTNRGAVRSENCFNTGDITGNTKVGGVVGDNNGALIHCYNLGGVTGVSSVGGVVGENGNANVSLSACFNNGNVSGETAVGGIAGKNSGVVSYNYNTGAVSGTSGVGAVVGTNFFGSEQRNYYLKTDSLNAAVGGIDGADRSGAAEGKSAEAFASGEVTHLLDFNFGQTLFGEDADAFPVFLTENNRVYRVYLSCVKRAVYSNDAEFSEKTLAHLDVNGDGACDYCSGGNAGAGDSDEGSTGESDQETNREPGGESDPDGAPVMMIVMIAICVVIVVGAVAFILIKLKKRA